MRYDSESYVVRKVAEDQIFSAVVDGRFASIVGPRQIGKTSLLNKVQAVVESRYGYASALVDLSAINDKSLSAQEWCDIFCQRLQEQLRPFLDRDGAAPPPSIPARFSEFWSQLGSFIVSPSAVILLDEANAIPDDIRDVFYSTIRSIYTNQQAERRDPNLAKYRFVFAGVFDPERLVKDRLNSPFNVSEIVRLPDFSPQEIRQLQTPFRRLIPEEQLSYLDTLSQAVGTWVGGHPYLSQELSYLVARRLEMDPTLTGSYSDIVAECVLELMDRAGDNIGHVVRLIDDAGDDADAYRKIVSQLLGGQRIAFTRVRSSIAALELMGAVKAGRSGECIIRNRVYENAFRSLVDESERWARTESQPGSTPVGKNVFVSYSRKDRKYLDLLRIYLRPLEGLHDIVVWDDTKAEVGGKWRDEIETAIENAGVAILLVSQDFIASEFINSRELPIILKSGKKGGLKILWVPVRSSTYQDTPIEEYQAVGDPKRPLNSLDESELDAALLNVYKAAKKALHLDKPSP